MESVFATRPGTASRVTILTLAIYGAALAFLAVQSDLRRVANQVIVASIVAGGAVIVLASLAKERVGSDRGHRDFRAPALLGLAFMARIALLNPESGLSDDFYRYAWEGRVVLAGENPFVHSPNDPSLTALRDDRIWPKITHRDVPAAYPPLAQMVFAIAALTPWPIGFLRVLFTGCEFSMLLIVMSLIARPGGSRAMLVLAALAPLMLLEYAGSMHFDSLALLGVAIAWHARERGRSIAAVGLIALATLAKPFPLVLLPLFLERRVWRSQIAIFLAVIVVAHLPFVRDGLPYRGLARYAEEWSFNAPLFPTVVALLRAFRDYAFDHGLTGVPWLSAPMRGLVESQPEFLARIALGTVLLGVAIAQWWPRVHETRSWESRALRVMLALLLCSPVVHPWYVTWLVPFAAVAHRDPLAKCAWLWVVLAPLGYHVLPEFIEYGIWREDRLWRAIQYAPVLLSIAWVGCFSSNSGSGPLGVSGAERIGSKDANPAQ